MLTLPDEAFNHFWFWDASIVATGCLSRLTGIRHSLVLHAPVSCGLIQTSCKYRDFLVSIAIRFSKHWKSVGITGEVAAPLSPVVLVKRRICHQCRLARMHIVKSSCLNCLCNCINKLTTLATNFNWVTSLCSCHLTPCDLGIVRKTRPVSVTSKCQGVIFFGWPRHSLDVVTLKSSCYRLAIIKICMCRWKTAEWATSQARYCWCHHHLC